MRCYHFGNFYMSSIQQGIQAAHAQMELVLKYKDRDENCKQKQELFDWASFHKTMICLNGGMNDDLHDLLALMIDEGNKFAWAHFNESQEAMGGMLTNIAIVLPEVIYETAEKLRKRTHYIQRGEDHGGAPGSKAVIENDYDTLEVILSEWEYFFINHLNKCGMAR